MAVIGFGAQGRAISLNLRDSGYAVTVGLRAHSKSRAQVKRERGLAVGTVAGAVAQADVVCFAFPDHRHAPVFEREIRPNLKSNAALWFLHGSSIHFGLVKPPADVAVLMIAPHGPGVAVREEYLGGRGLSAFYAVQGKSQKASMLARRLAAAIGIKPRNLLKTTFEREAVGDLFGEQAVLCGGLAALVQAGFQTLVDNGWPADHGYLEVAHQLDLIVALIKKHGLVGMLSRISPAAQLGSAEAGPRIIDAGVRRRMQRLFEDIAVGRFAKQLAGLDDARLRQLDRELLKLSDPRLERAARKFRAKKS
jgi:ketol-acid reductoisomerase